MKNNPNRRQFRPQIESLDTRAVPATISYNAGQIVIDGTPPALGILGGDDISVIEGADGQVNISLQPNLQATQWINEPSADSLVINTAQGINQINVTNQNAQKSLGIDINLGGTSDYVTLAGDISGSVNGGTGDEVMNAKNTTPAPGELLKLNSGTHDGNFILGGLDNTIIDVSKASNPSAYGGAPQVSFPAGESMDEIWFDGNTIGKTAYNPQGEAMWRNLTFDPNGIIPAQGASINDIVQGQSGICALLSSLGAIPAGTLAGRIAYLGADQYSVPFYDSTARQWSTATVSYDGSRLVNPLVADLSETSNLSPETAFEAVGGSAVRGADWVAIYQKAWISWCEKHTPDNPYNAMQPHYILKALTGNDSTFFAPGTTDDGYSVTPDTIAYALQQGMPVVATLLDTDLNVPHAFTLLSGEAGANGMTLSLRNPWSFDGNESFNMPDDGKNDGVLNNVPFEAVKNFYISGTDAQMAVIKGLAPVPPYQMASGTVTPDLPVQKSDQTSLRTNQGENSTPAPSNQALFQPNQKASDQTKHAAKHAHVELPHKNKKLQPHHHLHPKPVSHTKKTKDHVQLTR